MGCHVYGIPFYHNVLKGSVGLEEAENRIAIANVIDAHHLLNVCLRHPSWLNICNLSDGLSVDSQFCVNSKESSFFVVFLHNLIQQLCPCSIWTSHSTRQLCQIVVLVESGLNVINNTNTENVGILIQSLVSVPSSANNLVWNTLRQIKPVVHNQLDICSSLALESVNEEVNDLSVSLYRKAEILVVDGLRTCKNRLDSLAQWCKVIIFII